MILTKEKKKKIKETRRKKKAQDEGATEKTAFKKRLVEIKWFISGEKDILKVSMEEEIFAHADTMDVENSEEDKSVVEKGTK